MTLYKFVNIVTLQTSQYLNLPWVIMLSKSIIILVVFAIIGDYTVEGIHCYQCNSVNNSQCENLENYGPEKTILPTSCEVVQDHPESFCRKTVLYLLQRNSVIESRIIRSCGYLKYKKDCYKVENDDHSEYICQCFEDGCNTSTTTHPSVILILSILGLYTIQ
ncbi:uncharacterized protein LOC143914505 [Arctopsyche grandis]|uniref:uncharacterized protein LOC143914505 n=1 Tax=Arctopsyche grandis TaxID=121162 RepID=UPI00406D6348